MDGFDTLLIRVQEEARALGIPISGHICPQVAVNRRAVSRFGCCRRRKEGYQIELSHRLLTASEAICRQTLAHEVLHTCPGCQDHGPLWKTYAGRMNAAYGYEISRTATCQALGLPETQTARHLLVCQRCGMEFQRVRASRLVQHPERYRCKCGGALRRIC